MSILEMRDELTNWSKSKRSACLIYRARNIDDIVMALEAARAHHLSVIPHGAGHSYTDAALITNGIVIDMTPMRRILSWDPIQGIMRVEPGVTLREVIKISSKDGWWPFISPSTPEVTIGGCVAMNVNGKNSWKYGPFGTHIISLDVLLATGKSCALTPEQEPLLFHAFIGSMGLLGILTTVTLQLQRVGSGYVSIRKRSASSFSEIFAILDGEEAHNDFMEAWLDGFARGSQLGRGIVTTARLNHQGIAQRALKPKGYSPSRLETQLISSSVRLSRPLLVSGTEMINRIHYWQSQWSRKPTEQQRDLFSYLYWPPEAFVGYRAMFPAGVETFHAFVPKETVEHVFESVLHYSQEQGCMPLWCVVKKHRRDPFLLSYQVDGCSLELNYHRTLLASQKLKHVLQGMIATVVDAGGRFYLAKDHFLTHAQYRKSMGADIVDQFLCIKEQYDPEMLLQSDLFHRIFRPPLE